MKGLFPSNPPEADVYCHSFQPCFARFAVHIVFFFCSSCLNRSRFGTLSCPTSLSIRTFRLVRSELSSSENVLGGTGPPKGYSSYSFTHALFFRFMAVSASPIPFSRHSLCSLSAFRFPGHFCNDFSRTLLGILFSQGTGVDPVSMYKRSPSVIVNAIYSLPRGGVIFLKSKFGSFRIFRDPPRAHLNFLPSRVSPGVVFRLFPRPAYRQVFFSRLAPFFSRNVLNYSPWQHLPEIFRP